MSTKITMIRLPKETAENVQKLADKNGLAFATMVRSIVIMHLNEKSEHRGEGLK